MRRVAGLCVQVIGSSFQDQEKEYREERKLMEERNKQERLRRERAMDCLVCMSSMLFRPLKGCCSLLLGPCMVAMA